MLLLHDFRLKRPRYEIEQARSLAWLGQVHATAQATIESLSAAERDGFSVRLNKLIERCACGPDKISKRGYVLPEVGSLAWQDHELYDVTRFPHGRGSAVRSRLFQELVNPYFEAEYAEENAAPSELIHVTCTGYAAPSGAQRLVASKGWGQSTHVTHAYHMGCYAAFPAIRSAAGHLSSPATLRPTGTALRADIVHTELCTLHLDPSDHSAEQCVVQSLFGDGFIRYSASLVPSGPGLEVLALDEELLPDSAQSMSWVAADFGLHMTLARDVPDRIASALRAFVLRLFAKCGENPALELKHSVVAVHPGGPKIIDRVVAGLELREAQVQTSRAVLFDYGNMSSATLPHVWQRILADPSVSTGSLVLSLAFGPGLTVCGALFRKC
jgi:predicted naringenin-chalcone synthase